MADTENFDEFSDALGGLKLEVENFSGFLGKMRKAETKKNEDQLLNSKKLAQSIKNFDDRIDWYLRSAESAISQFRNSANGVIGTTFFVLAGRGLALSKTWQDMTNIGKTFGGSMMNMLGQASDAGLSLEEFADISKSHNLLINATNGSFFDMQKQLRKNISAQGTYGFTVSQLNDLMADQMEVSRLNGALGTRTNKQVIGDMQDLALTVTALADGSDKAREEISKLAVSAMSSALSISQIAATPSDIRGLVDKQVKEATLAFAALPGEAGDFFSKFFNETFGSIAPLTQQGQTLINAGLSSLASEMDGVATKFRAGQGSIEDEINFQNKFIKEVDANRAVLQTQAMAGNENAAQMLRMRAAMKETTMAELERRKETVKNTQTVTAFFASLESLFGMLKGVFFSKFIEGLSASFGKMDELANSQIFKNLETALGDAALTLGSTLGEFLRRLGPNDIKNFVTGMIDMTVSIFKFAAWFSKVIIPIIGGIAEALTGFLRMLDKIGLSSGTIGKLAAGLLIFSKITGMFKGLLGGMTGMMNVRAGVVNVIGGGGGLLGNLLGGGKSGGKGFLGKLGGLLGLGGGVAEGAAEGAAMGGLKGIGGSLVKGGLIGAGIESLGYLFGDKKFTAKNLGKSALALTGGALGALGGGLVTGGLGGEFVGGAAGYSAGNWLGDKIFGEDDKKDEEKPDTTTPDDNNNPNDVSNPQSKLLDELKKQTEMLEIINRTTAMKLDQAIRLLSKIEVSAQSL